MSTMARFVAAFAVTAVVSNATCSYASEGKLAVGGILNMQYGAVQQNALFRTSTPGSTGPEYEQHGLFSDTLLLFNYDAKADSGMGFGAEIKMHANTSIAAKNGQTTNSKNIMVYVQDDRFGKLALGAISGASITMRKGGVALAKAAGGIDGDYHFYLNRKTIDGYSTGTIFVRDPAMPIGCDCTSIANKISYYTPQYYGLQFGVSYTPDISIRGTVSPIFDLTKTIVPKAGQDPVRYTHVFEGGFSYEKKFSPYTVEFAALTQIGDVKGIEAPGIDRKPLRAWELSNILRYNEYAIGAAYGDWGNSGTSVDRIAGNKYGAHYYTLGASYTGKKFGASVTYLNSNRAGGSRVNAAEAGPIFSSPAQEVANNKYYAASYGAEYLLAAGFKTYIEFTQFEFDRASNLVDNDGNILLLGTKISF